MRLSDIAYTFWVHHHFLIVGHEPYRDKLADIFTSAQFAVSSANTFGQAIAFVRTQKATAIIFLGDASKKDLQEWVAALSLQPGTSSLPRCLVSVDTTPKAALAAFQTGIADIISAGLDGKSIAREIIDAIGLNAPDARAQRSLRKSGPDVLRRVGRYMRRTRSSCSIEIGGHTEPAAIRFADGNVVDAMCGTHTGVYAASMLLDVSTDAPWRFSLRGVPLSVPLPVTPSETIVADDEGEIVLFDEADIDISTSDEIEDISLELSEEAAALDLDFDDLLLDLEDEGPQDTVQNPPSIPAPIITGDIATAAMAVAPAPATTEPTVTPPDDVPMRILLVDDDPDLIALYKDIFTKSGFETLEAVNGSDGYAAARQHRPDIILSDIMMPVTDGWGFLGHVRGDPLVRETLFVLLSCHVDLLGKLRDFSAGADAYLEKGLRPSEVINAIRQVSAPRRSLYAQCKRDVPLAGDLITLGAFGLLTRLAEVKTTGVLKMKSGATVCEVHYSHGIITHAAATTNGVQTSQGEAAVQLFVEAQAGPFRFSPGETPVNTISIDLEALQNRLAENIMSRTATNNENLMAQDIPLRVTTAELGRLYEVSCPEAVRPIVHALFRGASPRTVMMETDVSPLLVESVVKDLLRKRVMRFDDSLT